MHVCVRACARVCVCVCVRACVCVCVLDGEGSRMVVSRTLAVAWTTVAWTTVYLTGYSDYLTGLWEPLSPPYWTIQAGLLTPLTFAQHRLSPLAAFTSGAYFLHTGRR